MTEEAGATPMGAIGSVPAFVPPVSRSKPHIYAALDSWRGICACMVALAHVPTIGQTANWQIIKHSYLFVDFFFVLSGFIIFENYFDRIKNGFSISRFMFLRFGRLYPLHLFVLSIFVITELSRLGMSEAVAAGARPAFTGINSGDALISQLFLLNAMSLQEFDTWNIPSWSIGAEFYTYLVFALIIRCSGNAIAWAIIAIALGAAAVLWSSGHPNMNITYDLGLIRCIMGFGIGALCSRIQQRRGAKPFAAAASATAGELIMLAVTVVFVVQAGDNRLSFLAPVIFAAVVLIFAQEAGAASRLLRTRPFRLLGRLSYSIYMVHFFVLIVLANAIRSVEPLIGIPLTTMTYIEGARVVAIGVQPWQGNIAHFLALIPVVLVAFVAYNLVEVPTRQLSRQIAPRIRL